MNKRKVLQFCRAHQLVAHPEAPSHQAHCEEVAPLGTTQTEPKTGRRWLALVSAIVASLLFTAVLAFSSGGESEDEHRSIARAAASSKKTTFRPLSQPAGKTGYANTAAPRHSSGDPFSTTWQGLAQAITLLEARGSRSFPRSPAAHDALWPFYPNLLDPSKENIAAIEQHALKGSDDALAAFMTVAAHLPDYRERSHHLLTLNAARGSVLALTTLSERAVIGFGFDKPDRAASIFFEYLAWSTGHWNSDPDSDSFRPSIAGRYSRAECEHATAFGNAVATQHDAYGERDISTPANCVDRQ